MLITEAQSHFLSVCSCIDRTHRLCRQLQNGEEEKFCLKKELSVQPRIEKWKEEVIVPSIAMEENWEWAKPRIQGLTSIKGTFQSSGINRRFPIRKFSEILDCYLRD